MLDQDLICQALGHFSLAGDEQHIIKVSEQIASQQYEDWESFFNTVRGFAINDATWQQERKSFIENAYFQHQKLNRLNPNRSKSRG